DPGKFGAVIRKELFKGGFAFALTFCVSFSFFETLKCFNHQTGRRHHEKPASEIDWLCWDMFKRCNISVSKAMQYQICKNFSGSVVLLCKQLSNVAESQFMRVPGQNDVLSVHNSPLKARS